MNATSIALASHLCTCVLRRQLCYLHTLKLPKFFNFHGDFHQKWHFAHPEFSFAHPELPFWLNLWPLDLTDDKPTLVHVMTWCRQAISYYLSQCWHRSMSPNGVTNPQWVNMLRSEQSKHHFLSDNFPCIFLRDQFCILFWISFKFVHKFLVD